MTGYRDTSREAAKAVIFSSCRVSAAIGQIIVTTLNQNIHHGQKSLLR